jgi:DNA-binding transcriptional MerR regulator
MANYSIKDLENLSGIKAHTLRIWEKRYNLVSPKRTSTNIRFYDDQDLKRILNISILNRNGVKISKIAQMCDEELRDKITHITQDTNDTDSQIERLCIAMIEIDEDKFENILSSSIFQQGFEQTMINILYPFFVKIGIMWQTGTINPAQEHFISNLVRQKLITAIDGQKSQLKEHPNKFLMFLPEGELHELGLLFFSYLIRKRGHKVIYLGQSVPYEDLRTVHNIRNADHLVTAFYTSMTNEHMIEYTEKLASDFPKSNIYIAGGHMKEILKELPENVKIASDPKAFVAEIEYLD